MWLITKILGFLSSGALDRILKHFETRAKLANDAEKLKADLISEAIKAEIDERKAITEQLRVEHGWAITRWIRPAFAYPLAIYYGAIIADSLFHFTWNVDALPDTMMSWSGTIIVFYFGGRTIERVAQIIKRR